MSCVVAESVGVGHPTVSTVLCILTTSLLFMIVHINGVCPHVCAYTCTHACMWEGQMSALGISVKHSFTSETEILTELNWLAGKLQGSSCLRISSAGIRDTGHHTKIFACMLGCKLRSSCLCGKCFIYPLSHFLDCQSLTFAFRACMCSPGLTSWLWVTLLLLMFQTTSGWDCLNLGFYLKL